MELLGIILSAIAAISAVATLWFSICNSKGYILRKIDWKQNKIKEIEYQLDMRYGLNRGRGGRALTPLDEKLERLKNDVTELRRKL